MSAANIECHKKNCLCATCTFICSRCFVGGHCPNNDCITGKKECENYEHVIYGSFEWSNMPNCVRN